MKAIIPDGIHPQGHYAPAIASRGMLYISGQLPIDPATGKVIAGGAAEQTRAVLGNIETILKAAGLRRENVVQCRLYLADVSIWDEVNAAYAAFFEAHKPARVAVPGVTLHHGALVEIEAIAEMEE